MARALHVGGLAALAAPLLALATAALAAGATVEVHLANVSFNPKELHISAGDTVVWVNDDSFAHDVTFEAGFGSGAAGSLAAGANWSHTFNDNGTFRYRCQIHATDFATGMVGSVVVGSTAAPPPAKSPGFEVAGALAAVGAAAVAVGARRKAP